MDNIQRMRTRLLIAAATFVLAACASLGGQKTITFSEADMTRLLVQHGPFQRRLLEVLDVRIDQPNVRLLSGSNRLASDLQLVTTERISGKTYQGHIAVDYALRYDATLQAVRMTQVHVDRLQIDDLPSPGKDGLNRLGALIAEDLLDGAVIYRFKPADLRDAEGRGYKPSEVSVTSRGVEVSLEPIRP
jgi:hypothetical protein